MFKLPEKLNDIDYSLLVFGRNLLEEVSNFQMGSIVRFNKFENHPLTTRIEGCKKTLEFALELKIEDAIKEEKMQAEVKDMSMQEILFSLSYFGYVSVLGEVLMESIDINHLQFLQRNIVDKTKYKQLMQKQSDKVEKLAKDGYKDMKTAQDIAYGIASGQLVYEFVHKDLDTSGPIGEMGMQAKDAMDKLYRDYCETTIRPAMMIDILKTNMQNMLESFQPVYKDGSERGAEKTES